MMQDSPMEEVPELLATRRSKRSTAGNRMEAALAEMALEDANKDLDDDNDFVNDKDEEDIFGSDFESTDEEAENQAAEAGENEVLQEERINKRAERTRLEKIKATAHARNKNSFNPDIQITEEAPKSRTRGKPRLRFSTDGALETESVERRERGGKDVDGKTRTSKRKHTIQNTSATVTRLKQSEAKKALQPKKSKVEYKVYTQAELIALALDTEEGNIVEHRDYLKNEVEKRKRARVVRATVEGPLIRWISRKEEIKVVVPPPPPPPAPVPTPTPVISQAPSSIFRSVYGPPGTLFTPTTYSYSGGMTIVSTNSSTSQFNMTTTTSYPHSGTSFTQYQYYPETSPFPTWPPVYSTQPSTNVLGPTTTAYGAVQQPTSIPSLFPTPTAPLLQEAVANGPVAAAPPEPESKPEPEYRMETVTKNYVIHELAQQKGGPKPTWPENMAAMFGDHVKWDQLKVYVGKNRPLSRPRNVCPITGRQAHYQDPRSGVPYANSYAYKTLTALLQHQYVWSAALGCYLNPEPPEGNQITDGSRVEEMEE